MDITEQKYNLKEFLKSDKNKGGFTLKHFQRCYNELYSDFLNWEFPNDFKFSQKLFHYLNEDKDLKIGLCPICRRRTKFLNFKTGYQPYCSSKCYGQSEESIERRKQTCLERYGVESYTQSEEMKCKADKTKLERYGDENFNNREKYKETCLEKYGKESYTQTDEYREKTIETNLEKYGANYPIQLDEFKEKSKQTCNERYGGIGNASEELREKQKKTNKERYGDENFVNTEKSKQICLKKYGVEYYTQTDEYKEKAKQTKLERYGDEIYVNSEKYKQICLEKYGKESYLQTDEYKEKCYETKKKNHTFNSSKIEKEFANYLKENNIKFESQYKTKEYPYACDFYLNDYNLYVEIQGNWTHGKHPFDENNEEDRMILDNWKSKNTKFYLNAIDVWTIRDVKKRNVAKENNLIFLEIFSCKLEECILSLNKKIGLYE